MEKRTLPKDREFSFTSMTYVQFEIDESNEYRYIEYPDPFFSEMRTKHQKILMNSSDILMRTWGRLSMIPETMKMGSGYD
jgi:hypothetical protein